MKDYTKPSINIARFGAVNIVTVSDKTDTYQEDAGITNQANAEAYLATDFAKTNTVISFMDE